MEYLEDDLADLRAYAAQWDAESAGAEVRLDRVADAYEAGMLVPTKDAEPATVPLPAFVIMCVVAAVLVATILLVG